MSQAADEQRPVPSQRRIDEHAAGDGRGAGLEQAETTDGRGGQAIQEIEDVDEQQAEKEVGDGLQCTHDRSADPVDGPAAERTSDGAEEDPDDQREREGHHDQLEAVEQALGDLGADGLLRVEAGAEIEPCELPEVRDVALAEGGSQTELGADFGDRLLGRESAGYRAGRIARREVDEREGQRDDDEQSDRQQR